MNHGYVNKYYALGDFFHGHHCIFTCKTQSWPWIFLKCLVITMKVFFALKVHKTKVCCVLAAHSAILTSKQSPFKRLVSCAHRKKTTYTKERDIHLRKLEGSMFTEGKRNNLTSLVKISESSALLCNSALYSDLFTKWPWYKASKEQLQNYFMLTCCLWHTYFFCQTCFTANQIYHMKSGKGRRLQTFLPFTFHRAQNKE